jgi:Holliday junction resolvase
MARNYYDDEGCFTNLFKIGIVVAIFFGVLIGLYNFLDNNSKYISENYTMLFFLIIAVIVITSVSIYLNQKKKLNTKINDLEKTNKELNSQKSQIENTLIRLKDSMEKKDNLFESYKNIDIFTISTLYSDFLTLEYSLSEEWLDKKEIIVKHNPNYYSRVKIGRTAKKSAEIVSELKRETKSYIEQYKIMLYKYEALLSLFPELKNYVDDIEAIKELNSYTNLDSFKEEYDKVIDYISKEEYNRLSVDDRNQLALNNYIKGKKSKWQIGRDFEMYCSYNYEKQGWHVERHGIEKRLNDMGRDIIATKGDTVHIIQCKLWSNDKLIHEKHIAQLYGSTIEYMISIETTLFKQKIVPVFITNIDLSETAQKFAKRLNVLICKWQLQDYPRIKCNINNGEKIYHLPFDQQYDRTQIKNNGESYEFSVKEAVSKGFKRAKRHYFQ